jgi:hypothetical protein
MINQPTDQLTAEESKYSHNRAQQRQHPTNNMFEVRQNLAIFGGRPIGIAIEALLTIVVNWLLSYLPIVVFLLPPPALLLACCHSVISIKWR